MTTTPASSSKRTKDGIDIYKDHEFIDVFPLTPVSLFSISHPVFQNKRFKLNSNAPFTPAYVTSQLTQTTDASSMYASRVKGRQMLLENPARESRAKKESQEKREKQRALKEKKRGNVMGKREAKEKGVWRFDKSQAK